jgi:hypothetical protein
VRSAVPVAKSMAPPMPCRMRETIITAGDHATAESREKTANTTLP